MSESANGGFPTPQAMADLLGYPLMGAMFGRRARRFGVGMEIPSGPLAYRSRTEPFPLTELEKSILIAAGTGVSGWNFGVPFSPARPKEHADLTVRFTGRTAPTAAGIGTPVLFHTDDEGTYVTNTRDVVPDQPASSMDDPDQAAGILAVCREHTEQLTSRRLDLPSAPPHMLPPNVWMANAPGSTLLMPVADASEQFLGLLSIFLGHGNVIVDDEAGQPAGRMSPFIRSGLLDEEKKFPLSVLEHLTYEANTTELAFMAHNITLTMQAVGLGGLYYNGINRWSVMGAMTADDIEGLGFRFVADERWTVPNPVGLDGVLEGLCPPYYPDMRAAVEGFVERKFGPGGAYNPANPQGPWKDARIGRDVDPYTDEFVDCLSEVAQYVYEKHGKFPGTITTMVLSGFVQAHHIDTEYYDTYFQPGAYLETHARHAERWHPSG